MAHYRGLTWDHPRGTEALRAAAALRPVPGDTAGDLSISWDTHSLEGFESSSIEELAANYDLIVLDHPHLGDATASDSLVPLEELFAPHEMAALSARSVGPSDATYLYNGKTYALALDAATQVSARRGGLFPDAPATWDAVRELGARVPVALSLAGPHAFLTFCSIAVSLGEEPFAAAGPALVSRETGGSVLELMAGITALAPAGTETMNPIAMLEAMASGGPLAYCPLIYGYVNYARTDRAGRHAGGARHRLAFGNAPSRHPGGRPGSTIGGTGLAVSRRCAVTPALLDHIRWLVAAPTQATFIPDHHGQPASRTAWLDDDTNAAAHDFYRDTLDTIDQSWVRPRFAGFTRLQADASDLVRRAVTGELAHARALASLDALVSDAISLDAARAGEHAGEVPERPAPTRSAAPEGHRR